MKSRLAFLLILLLMPNAARAVQPNEMLADPQMELRAREISKDLRCLVCQNQSIDDSDAELAHDLRVLVRQRLQAGDSDAQVEQFLVARYGDYVLLTPPFKSSTVALWMGPPFFLMIGGLCAWVVYRRREDKATSSDKKLTPQERERLAAMMPVHLPTDQTEGKNAP
jgi:cytochrome c-type biogenesis protein CcmH